MKCSECGFHNLQGSRVCNMCGTKLILIPCPSCENGNPPGSKYCNQCGSILLKLSEDIPATHLVTSDINSSSGTNSSTSFSNISDSERKYVTVLFSDLAGYTTLSEKLDPEEVKEIMNGIFGDVTRIVARYEGYIDKFIGDAVMVLFGFPKVREDDPIRAIMAAREIHESVNKASHQVEGKIGRSISMHTGINTGLVVTDEMDIEKGKHGMTGDTINLASRLTDIAEAGEILVGPDTYYQCQGYFDFVSLKPAKVKGKAEPINIYKVLSVKGEPVKRHGLSGLRAELIGRNVEMDRLKDAVHKLKAGDGGIVSIYGDAGTGKSRLMAELKASPDLSSIRWCEGCAYSYAENIPYFLIINFLNRILGIEEGDSPEELRKKIESGIKNLVDKWNDVIPCIGSLYALGYPEVKDMSPELWKSFLQKSIRAVMSGLTRNGPVIICFEDLQWADSSSIELLRTIFSNIDRTILFLCVHRPSFSLFTGQIVGKLGDAYQEIRLREFPPSEIQTMVKSLLKTRKIPRQLKQFIQSRVEGNPFYIEEIINVLVESGMLYKGDDTWKVSASLDEARIPSTIQGIISARLDRFERQIKRLMQEASVMGRAFSYDILKRISALEGNVAGSLSELERYDIIKTRSIHPELVYVFKHALTQEVVYNSLLRSERRDIHERIAMVMEELFHDRLPEFYEILAFHFTRGVSILKGIRYLMKSGEKNVARYSLDESHQYYEDAFNLLSFQNDKTDEEKELLIDLLNKWAIVYNQRGDYSGLLTLFSQHEGITETLKNRELVGMFYGWSGWSLRQREELREAYEYLASALAIGDEIGSPKVTAYACAWLTQTCADLGHLDEAVIYGRKAAEFSDLLKNDQLFFQFCMVGLGLTHYFRGESKSADQIGKKLLEYGQYQSDIRSTAMGYNIVGLGRLAEGNFVDATKCFGKAIQITLDPMISCLSLFFLGMSYLFNEQLSEAERTFEEVIKFNDDFGLEAIGTSAEGLQGIVRIARGELSAGIKITEGVLQAWRENGSKYRQATMEHLLGKIYLHLVTNKKKMNFLALAKNIGFLVKNGPRATTKAETYFQKALTVASEIGAKGIAGQANLDLGILYKEKGKKELSEMFIKEAIHIFRSCEAEVFLEKARCVLESVREQ